MAAFNQARNITQVQKEEAYVYISLMPHRHIDAKSMRPRWRQFDD